MADVSAMMHHEMGAAANVNMTEAMSPKDAWAFEAAFDVPTEAAIPRATSITALNAVPQR
jgi:hypothetical protein